MAFNSLSKQKIRQEWNAPLLAYLSKLHNVGFHYFGFPGIEAHDIVLWREYIDTVTAFEAPDNPQTGEGNKSASQLELKLIKLGFEPECFVGYLENIIQTKVDNTGRKFKPERFYTLFNLDFMNYLTSRTKVKQVLIPARNETFSKIASMLKDVWNDQEVSGSVWLITLREEINKTQYSEWRSNLDDPQIIRWVDQYDDIDIDCGRNMIRNPYKLKAFLYKTIKTALDGVRFSSYWYPMALYTGDSSRSPMAHFMILSHANQIGNTIQKTLQTTNEFLKGEILNFTPSDVTGVESRSEYVDVSRFVQSIFSGIKFPFIQPL